MQLCTKGMTNVYRQYSETKALDSHINCLFVPSINSRPRPIARIESGEVRNLPKVDHLDLKSGLFEPYPPQASYKNSIFGPLCG